MNRVKYKYIIVVLVIGFIINSLGAVKKIMHQPGADKLLRIGLYMMVASGVTAVIKAVFSKSKNSFPDK